MTELPKTRGSRFTDVETHKCRANEIQGLVSLKSAADADEFVHVIASRLQDTDTEREVVVKIHQANHLFVKKELDAMKRVQGWANTAQYLCDYTCSDKEKRWYKDVQGPTRFCNNKGDSLHFIVMEYIRDADLADFLSRATQSHIKSLFVQATLAIVELAYTYKLHHGDLNSGNLLVSRTPHKSHTYEVDGTSIRVKTHGILPILIDFGRGASYTKRPQWSLVKDDILTMFAVMIRWIPDNSLATRLDTFVYEASGNKNMRIKELVTGIKNVFSKKVKIA